MTYRRNKKAILKCLEFSFSLLTLPIVCYFINRNYGTFVDMRMIFVLTMVPVFLSILLLIDYYFNETKGTIILRTDNIEILNNTEHRILDGELISQAVVYGTPSVYRKSFFRVLPMEAFHYVDISLKNGESIFITSLSDFELYWKLLDEPILKGKLFLFKGGWLKKGELINSIWLNRQK